MTGKERDSSYVLVGNIPANFHSVDLRAFFSQFTETGKFQCFHFRHRPEILKKKEEQNGTVEESLTMKGKTTCCVVRLKQEHVKDLFEAYYGENWTDRNGKLCPLKVVIFRISVKDSGSCKLIRLNKICFSRINTVHSVIKHFKDRYIHLYI